VEMPYAPAHKVLPVWRATAERQTAARSNCLVNARQHLLDPLMRDRKPALLHQVAIARRLLPAFCIRRIARSTLRSLSSGSSDPSAPICQPNSRLPPRKRPRVF